MLAMKLARGHTRKAHDGMIASAGTAGRGFFLTLSNCTGNMRYATEIYIKEI